MRVFKVVYATFCLVGAICSSAPSSVSGSASLDASPASSTAQSFRAEYDTTVRQTLTLRGVMCVPKFDEDTFRELRKWNVNLIRWQLVRAWGAANSDRDIAEYDRWIDAALRELDRALPAAKSAGIRVVIDMHSPVGGRYENNGMAVFSEGGTPITSSECGRR